MNSSWQGENIGLSQQVSQRIPQIYPQEEGGVEGGSNAKAAASGAFATYLLQFSEFPFPLASALQAWELPAWELSGFLGPLPLAVARARPTSGCRHRSPAW